MVQYHMENRRPGSLHVNTSAHHLSPINPVKLKPLPFMRAFTIQRWWTAVGSCDAESIGKPKARCRSKLKSFKYLCKWNQSNQGTLTPDTIPDSKDQKWQEHAKPSEAPGKTALSPCPQCNKWSRRCARLYKPRTRVPIPFLQGEALTRIVDRGLFFFFLSASRHKSKQLLPMTNQPTTEHIDNWIYVM